MSWQSLAEQLGVADGTLHLRRVRLAVTTLQPSLRRTLPDTPEILADLSVHDGRITAVQPAADTSDGIDLRGRWLLPPFVDAHTHLDKTFTATRLEHAEPSLLAAVRATMSDRVRWNADDVERRAEHAIRLALAHGSNAIRTHVDVRPGEPWTGWETLLRLRSRWQDHLRIDMVAMLPMEACLQDSFGVLADRIADDGGLLGGVTKAIGKPQAAERELVNAALDALMRAAHIRNVAIDLHADESCDPSAVSLDWVIDKAIEHNMQSRVTCGHCCSLSYREAEAMTASLTNARAAGLSFVMLPLANEYLQDRTPGRTPRLRGIAPVLEMKAAGLPLAMASDNCGDAFYPFGQYDPLEVLRAAVRMAHLDAPLAGWLPSITTVPATLPGGGGDNSLAIGGPADFNLFDATDIHALLSCPQSRRLQLRRGRTVRHDWPESTETL